jgi:glycine/D-amino acid oxidase-like deaminating enzyme
MIGGGVMACATAYHLLKRDPQVSIAIVERDPTYAQSSTVLSDGNTRIQFNLRENILISQYGLEVLAVFADDMAVGGERPDIAFRQQGNLFLTDSDGQESALAGLALQQSLGCSVAWLSPAEVAARCPFIDPSTIVGGTWGPQDGTMDPQAVLLGYKHKAIDLGAHCIINEVSGVLVERGAVQGVRLRDGSSIAAPIVLNSSGAWGTEIARSVGIELPIEPIMRHVFHLETTVRPQGIAPLIVFPSGLYLIHEHDGHFTCGKSLDHDPIGYDFTFRRSIFTEYLWEDLITYAPAFEQVKVVGGWTGLYDVNILDHNPLIGEWPHLKGFYLVHGFSGHGFQQCHAVGRCLAETILGQKPSLDLSIFSPARILNGVPINESRQRII